MVSGKLLPPQVFLLTELIKRFLGFIILFTEIIFQLKVAFKFAVVVAVNQLYF